MSRLANLRPTLKSLPDRLRLQPPPSDTLDHLYSSRRWAKLRWSVLVRDLFTCQLCHQVVADTKRLVCDHIDPHRGDLRAFWAGPFQTLCVDCHNSVKQREDHAK